MTWEPSFLAGAAGPLFSIYFPPQRALPEPKGVVFVPPFVEELNQSRRMVTLQARELSEAGVGVLLLDLFGTGDSAGAFSDATWEIWSRDIALGLDVLEQRGLRPGLWGLRLGGLLAMQVAAAQRDRVSSVVLWQPIVEGKRMLTQFLRTRLAAAMADGGAQETTGDLRRALAEGTTLEIGGYPLSPALALAIDEAKLAQHPPAAQCRCHWFEIVPRADSDLPPSSRRILEGWEAQGASLTVEKIAGEAFWSIQEPSMLPELWQATVRALIGEAA